MSPNPAQEPKSTPRPDPIGDIGRAILRVLLDPASWKPGRTRAIVTTLRRHGSGPSSEGV